MGPIASQHIALLENLHYLKTFRKLLNSKEKNTSSNSSRNFLSKEEATWLLIFNQLRIQSRAIFCCSDLRKQKRCSIYVKTLNSRDWSQKNFDYFVKAFKIQIPFNWIKLVTLFCSSFRCIGRSSRAMNAIRAGMKMWSDNTCIKFRERRGNERSYANFQTGGG